MQAFRAVLAAGAMVLALAASAADAATWQSQIDLGAVSGSGSDVVGSAIESDGTAHVAWLNQAGGVHQLVTATRPAGGSWGAPVALTPASPAAADVTDFAFAGNDAGALVAVWVDSANARVQMRWRDPGGAWSSSQEVGTATAGSPYGYVPAATVDPSGWATVTWIENVGCDMGSCSFKVNAATHATAASTATVSLATWLGGPAPYAVPAQVAITSNARGDALIAWNYFATAGTIGTGASLSTQHGTFEFGDAISKLSGAIADRVIPLLDDDGNATVIASQQVSGGSYAVHATDRAVGGSWPDVSSSTLISAPGDSAEVPVAAVSTHGRTIVAWTESYGALGEAHIHGTARASFAGAWSAPTELAPDGSPALSVTLWGARVRDDGSATLLFNSHSVTPTPGWGQVLERTTGGTWASARKISSASNPDQGSWSMALDDNAAGDLLATWKMWPNGGAGHRVYAALTDRPVVVPPVAEPPAPPAPPDPPASTSPGPPAPPDPPASTSPGPPAPPDPPASTSPDPPPHGVGPPSPLTIAFASTQPKASFTGALRNGLSTAVACNRPCRLTARLLISAATARRLGVLAASSRTTQPMVIGRGSASTRSAGDMTRLVAKLNARVKRALARRRSVIVQVSITASSASEQVSRTRTVALR